MSLFWNNLVWYNVSLNLFVGVSGLAELASRKYKPAAKCFLQASFDHCDCPEVSDVTNKPFSCQSKNIVYVDGGSKEICYMKPLGIMVNY